MRELWRCTWKDRQAHKRITGWQWDHRVQILHGITRHEASVPDTQTVSACRRCLIGRSREVCVAVAVSVCVRAQGCDRDHVFHVVLVVHRGQFRWNERSVHDGDSAPLIRNTLLCATFRFPLSALFDPVSKPSTAQPPFSAQTHPSQPSPTL